LDDLASFWVNLNTRVADDSANGDNTSSLCHCQKNLYPLNKAAIDAVKKKLLIDEDAFRREFALARLIHLLNMLTGWPNQFSKHRVNQVVTWAWNEVDKAQKELCNS
jgi:hypothetical protein